MSFKSGSSKNIFLAWIVSAFFFGAVAQAEDYALLINGGAHPSVNYARYYRNLKKVHAALRDRGMPRERIRTLYADGTVSTENTVEDGVFFKSKPWGLTNSLAGDDGNDITGPATKAEFHHQLEELSKKLKPGDHLFLFVTDHGSSTDGAAMSDGTFFNEKDLTEGLKHFQRGVKIHGLTTFCWGGRYVLATSRDACFFSNTDTEHLAYANAGNDPFVDSFLAGWKKRKSKRSLIDAADYAREEDSTNLFHTNSLDYFMKEHANEIAQRKAKSGTCASCRENRIATGKELTAEIEKVANLAPGGNAALIELRKKGLQDRLTLLEKELNSDEHRKLEKELARLESQKTALGEKWSRLPESTQNKERSRYTRDVEKLTENMAAKTAGIHAVRARHARTLWELDFLQYAMPEELAEYSEIRSCVEYTF